MRKLVPVEESANRAAALVVWAYLVQFSGSAGST